MTTATQISLKRQLIATGLGVVTLLCAVLLYLSYGFVMWHGVPEVDAGPLIVFLVWMFTATPAIICTLVSLALVCPQRCKLAWISLCMYPLFFILVLIIAICAPHH